MLLQTKPKPPVSDAEAHEILANAFDAQKVLLICTKHGLTEVPTSGCRDCWFAYYVRMLQKFPRERWAEELDALRTIVHRAVEAEERGQFDFVPFQHANIKIEKE